MELDICEFNCSLTTRQLIFLSILFSFSLYLYLSPFLSFFVSFYSSPSLPLLLTSFALKKVVTVEPGIYIPDDLAFPKEYVIEDQQ